MSTSNPQSGNLIMPELTEDLQIKDTFFDNNIDIDNWALENTNNFSTFINTDFKNTLDDKLITYEEDSSHNVIRYWNNKENKFVSIRPFKHQLFVKNYLNNTTPYRGLLLYHGLGSGKSGASVIIAEGFSERQVVILLPASLETNYQTEILTFGSQAYKKSNYWVFVPFSLGRSDKSTKEQRTEIYTIFENIGISRQILNLLRIKRKEENIIRKKKNKTLWGLGIWIINTSKQYPNYLTEEEKQKIEEQDDYTGEEVIEILTDDQKEEIDHQTEIMYTYKYKFIHTNAGSSTIRSILKLSKKFNKIKKKLFGKIKSTKLSQENLITIIDNMYSLDINPFDDKVIIVDEVHNLASAIAGNGYNGPLIYELLMRAKNCKLVLLSGTPVINNTYELAIICNLLKGFTISYEFTLLTSISDIDTFNAVMKQNTSIYSYNIDNLTIQVIENPKKFTNPEQDEHTFKVKYDRDDILLDKTFPEFFIEFINENNFKVKDTYSVQYYTVFNDILTGDNTKWKNKDLRIQNMAHNSEATDVSNINPFRLMAIPYKKKAINKFLDRYIKPEDLTVLNILDFKKRILGIISFYNEVATHDIDNPIFPDIIYAPNEETSVEMSNFQFKLYVIDREVEREYEQLGKKLSRMDNVLSTANLFKVYSRTLGIIVFPPNIERPRHSIIKQIIEVEYPDASQKEKKKLIGEKYIQQCHDAMNYLTNAQLRYDTESEPFNLNILSPKYTLMLKNINLSPGLVFCYSQFRSIEGIGLFTKILAANGYYLYTKHKSESNIKDINFKINDKVRYETVPNQWDTYTILKIENNDMPDDNAIYHIKNNRDEIIETEHTHIYKCYFSLWTGEEKVSERRRLLTHFNNTDNKFGTQCLILLTTSAGSEGISLMNVRQVHIIEPYWNNVRIKQVIGRARRVRSHIHLPIEQRNVKIFQYIIRFTKKQLDNSWWIDDTIIQDIESRKEDDVEEKISIKNMSRLIKDKDEGLTSDETLYNIAANKSTILNKFLKIFKEVAVDCVFNREDNILTKDVDVENRTDFVCYKNITSAEDGEDDKQDSMSLNIFSEHSNSDVISVDDSSVTKEIKKKIIINQPTLANGVSLHSIILDVPQEYNLISYLEHKVSFKIPVYNLYSYYSLTTTAQTSIIGYLIRNPDGSFSITNIDTTLLSFTNIKEYMLIEKAISLIDLDEIDIKSPLKNNSNEITPAETIKWVSYVKEKINELKKKEKWTCKICNESYSLDIHNCLNHPRMTQTLYYKLKDKHLKKKLRLLS